MNVTFRLNDELCKGYVIKSTVGLNRYVAEDERYIICFETDAGMGTNYSRILWYTDKKNGRHYRGMRYLYKLVRLVQDFSDILYQRYRDENREECNHENK